MHEDLHTVMGSDLRSGRGRPCGSPVMGAAHRARSPLKTQRATALTSSGSPLNGTGAGRSTHANNTSPKMAANGSSNTGRAPSSTRTLEEEMLQPHRVEAAFYDDRMNMLYSAATFGWVFAPIPYTYLLWDQYDQVWQSHAHAGQYNRW